MSNKKAEFAVKILKEYAHENGIPARSTSDLSSLEEWLLLRLYKYHASIPSDTELDEKASQYVSNLHEKEDGDFTHEAEIFDAGAIWMRDKIFKKNK